MAAVGEPLKEFGPWSEQTSSTGRKYYYNCETEVSQWEKPKEWKELEQRLEAERIAEQHRMQQPIPPPQQFFSPSFPYPGPPPGFPGFPSGPFPNTFVPPAAVPPMPPPPRATPTRHPDAHRRTSPNRRTYQSPVAPSPHRTLMPTPPSRSQGQPRSSSNSRNYGRPSPAVPSGSQSRYSTGHDSRTTPSQSESSRSHLRDDQKSAPHPYATPQPLNPNQPYRDQQTPKRVSQRDSRDGGYDFDREKGKATKRDYDSGYNGEDRSVKRPAKDEEERVEQPTAPPKQEENMEQETQEGGEEWRPYYRPELSKKKAAELGLEDDPELSDIQMQCLALENKWQNAEIQAKETAASRIVLEHEVAMTNLRIESCRKQQREIEAKTAQQVPLSGEKRKEYLENLLRRLRAMKQETTTRHT